MKNLQSVNITWSLSIILSVVSDMLCPFALSLSFIDLRHPYVDHVTAHITEKKGKHMEFLTRDQSNIIYY